MTVRESDGAMAFAVGMELLLYLPEDTQPRRVTLMDEKIGNLCFRNEELLAVTDTGYLLRYDTDLTLLDRVGLTVSYSFNTDLFSKYADIRSITWQFGPQNTLYLNLFNTMNVIDCDHWASIAYVPRCVLYDMATDQFLCAGDDRLRAHERYDIQELLELAKEELGSFVLSEQQRQAYGLDS